uniref:Tr-type G domain-containing protein n=1 Tax=Sphenodon punctatus TaxID=8508 RepID=A0A8D0GAV4_SPHPU
MSGLLLNVNVGVLGHIDSGKTALARALSTIGSTAAFDRAPQSRARGITLDLGFSCLCTELPPHLGPGPGQLQLTLVDCPGHASLIRTIIGVVHRFPSWNLNMMMRGLLKLPFKSLSEISSFYQSSVPHCYYLD